MFNYISKVRFHIRKIFVESASKKYHDHYHIEHMCHQNFQQYLLGACHSSINKFQIELIESANYCFFLILFFFEHAALLDHEVYLNLLVSVYFY